MGDEIERFAAYRIPYGEAVDEVVRLRAAASATLNLTSDAASVTGSEKGSEIEWAPEGGRPAQPVEVRARAIGFQGNFGLNEQPIIRWRMLFGHGTAVWQDPQLQNPGILRASVEYTVPARGLMFRMTTRELKLVFRNAGNAAGTAPVLTNIQLQVTIQPVGSAQFDSQQYEQQRTNIADPTVRNQFPASAREWRLRGEGGLAIPAGPTVNLFSMTGVLYSTNPCASYADWQPIPAPANSWNVNAVVAAGAIAHYR